MINFFKLRHFAEKIHKTKPCGSEGNKGKGNSTIFSNPWKRNFSMGEGARGDFGGREKLPNCTFPLRRISQIQIRPDFSPPLLANPICKIFSHTILA
jgi:hypothetical protein